MTALLPHGAGAALARLRRLLVGPGGEPQSYLLSRALFLRLLALVYAVAFASLWVQVDGLAGEQGVLPAAEYLAALRERAGGGTPWLDCPTLLWLDAGGAALERLCAAGVALAVLLAVGVAPKATALLLWLAYLSLASAVPVFLNFQWDALLLEAGLVAVLLAPLGLRPRCLYAHHPGAGARFLLRWLLFRLMFLSGAVKLLSGDPAWADLTALDYHYWTQPLPSFVSYWMFHLPAWFHRVEVVATFALELALPVFFFAPRRLRVAAALCVIGFQLVLAATGNYGFFNLLTAVLCVPLLDDATLRRLAPRALRAQLAREARPLSRTGRALRAASAPLVLALGGLGAVEAVLPGALDLLERDQLPGWVARVRERAAPLRSVNAYGLFRVMTVDRPEIIVEGSRDGRAWVPYVFRYKPGPLDRAPAVVPLHMPRLDWQMWFAALSGFRGTWWFPRFEQRLLEGSPAVLALLEANPFPDAPPRYVRATLHRYRFSTPAMLRARGEWWQDEPLGAYSPVLTLDAQGGLRVQR